MSKKYDTLVCSAVKQDPLGFVDALYKEAELVEKDGSHGLALTLSEAACVIANLLLTDENWHKVAKDNKS